MAKVTSIRFSTKYQDDESDLLYYGYRYYKPSTGDWLSRDQLSDWAFLSSYIKGKSEDDAKDLSEQSVLPPSLFVRNDPIDAVDLFGLARGEPIPPDYSKEIFIDLRWKCTCFCKIAYKDHKIKHTALEEAIFDSVVDQIRGRLYRQGDPASFTIHARLCDQLQDEYRAYY